jgi:sugar phosphate isomerase/epimerase
MGVHFPTRRAFLQAAAALPAVAQQIPQTNPPVPPPRSARVTSGVVLSTLPGPFEEKVAIAARSGIQSIELADEYGSWSEIQATRYKDLAESYGLGINALLAHDMNEAIDWAKRLNVPQIILPNGNEQSTQVTDRTLLLRNLQAVKDANSPHLRLLFEIDRESIAEVIPYVNVFHVGNAQLNWDNIYRTIGKAGYAGYITFKNEPKGDPVENLIRSVTQMRKALNAASSPSSVNPSS